MKFHPVTVLLDLIYPPKCVLCGTLLTWRQHDFCDSCRKTLPVCDEKLHRTEVFDGVTAALWYQGAVRGSILRYKFSGRSHYSRCMAVSWPRPVSGCPWRRWTPSPGYR